MPSSRSRTVMKAVYYREHGPPACWRPVSCPGPSRSGQVLVRVAAAAVNPIDRRYGLVSYRCMCRTFPVVPGWDFSGIS